MTRSVLRSYKLTTDSGFAPNPFWGKLTLATCKADIRRVAEEGEWIAGFTSGTAPWHDPVGEERLIYLMQVERIVPYEEYYRSAEFRDKIPKPDDPDPRRRYGDNMYVPIGEGASLRFCPVPGACHGQPDLAKDTSGLNALISGRFVYFGRKPLKLPRDVRPDIPIAQSRFGRFTHDSRRVRAFLSYVHGVAGLDAGLLNLPGSWSENECMSLATGTPLARRC